MRYKILKIFKLAFFLSIAVILSCFSQEGDKKDESYYFNITFEEFKELNLEDQIDVYIYIFSIPTMGSTLDYMWAEEITKKGIIIIEPVLRYLKEISFENDIDRNDYKSARLIGLLININRNLGIPEDKIEEIILLIENKCFEIMSIDPKIWSVVDVGNRFIDLINGEDFPIWYTYYIYDEEFKVIDEKKYILKLIKRYRDLGYKDAYYPGLEVD